MVSSDWRKAKPAFAARGAIAAILDDLQDRMAIILNDRSLSPEEKARLIRAVRSRAQVELGQLAGLDGVDQALVAQTLAEVFGVVAEERPNRPWWRFWR